MGAPELAAEGRFSAVLGGIRLLFGPGRIEELGELVRELAGRRVLLVTDPGIRRAGHVDRALESLLAAGVEALVFDRVEPNPTTAHVRAGVELVGGRSLDGIVGLGGGSAMDCAKGINFILTNGGRMEDYRGTGKATRPMLPSVGVPTTGGTGSEAQSYALISREDTRVKMACGDSKARFRAVVLDPALLEGVPPDVAATAGVDAVAHALESFVTRPRNPVSAMFSAEAWRLLDLGFEAYLDDSRRMEPRGRMLLGAHLSGAAIEQSMLGAAHACANPLTTRHGIVHGAAVGLMLPWVMQFNEPQVGELYDELARRSEPGGDRVTLRRRVAHLVGAAGLPLRLRDHDVGRETFAEMATEAGEQWTGGFNPRPLGREEVLTLYESAW